MARILTGIKPTGPLHLGNYTGCIKKAIAFSHDPQHQVIFMCADWHGLTNRAEVMAPGKFSYSIMCLFLALGFSLDEGNAIILQSDFFVIQENAWYLACATGAGLLERSHAYKDALANGKEATAGLLFYPVLMAADILTFGATLVPVGKDQAQHLEYASDMSRHFNTLVGQEIYAEPLPLIEDIPTLPGLDGERKMSKSYGNTIPIFAPKKDIEKCVKSIKTDSLGVDDPKDPENCPIFQIFKSFARPEALAHMEQSLRQGKGYGYGHAKMDFIAEHEAVFGSKRELFEHYVNSPTEVAGLLKPGYTWARGCAEEVTQKARKALGLAKIL